MFAKSWNSRCYIFLSIFNGQEKFLGWSHLTAATSRIYCVIFVLFHFIVGFSFYFGNFIKQKYFSHLSRNFSITAENSFAKKIIIFEGLQEQPVKHFRNFYNYTKAKKEKSGKMWRFIIQFALSILEWTAAATRREESERIFFQFMLSALIYFYNCGCWGEKIILFRCFRKRYRCYLKILSFTSRYDIFIQFFQFIITTFETKSFWERERESL